MKLKTGYRPWVARKAPLFNHSLNATYIKLSALLPIVAVSLSLGAAVGLTSARRLLDLNLSKTKPALEVKSKKEPVKPVASSISTSRIEAPILVPSNKDSSPASNTVKVPAIPKQNSESTSTQPINIAK